MYTIYIYSRVLSVFCAKGRYSSFCAFCSFIRNSQFFFFTIRIYYTRDGYGKNSFTLYNFHTKLSIQRRELINISVATQYRKSRKVNVNWKWCRHLILFSHVISLSQYEVACNVYSFYGDWRGSCLFQKRAGTSEDIFQLSWIEQMLPYHTHLMCRAHSFTLWRISHKSLKNPRSFCVITISYRFS